MKTNLKLCFVGGGNMATALVGGLAGKLIEGGNIHVIDLNPDSLRVLQQQFGVSTAQQIDARLADSDVIVLAVKPQQMKQVASEVAAHLKSNAVEPLVLSIAAGIRAADLSRWLNGHGAIVRTMPNTPALIGKGVTGMVAMQGVSPEQHATADAIMRAVGETVWLTDEAMIDPLTAVSGSGPAYVFYFIEAMQQAAQEMGLDPQQARQLALSTFSGAAQLAAGSPDPVANLRERVTSKGGTTHAALTSMEQDGVKEAIVRAIRAAADRGRQLGDEFGRD